MRTIRVTGRGQIRVRPDMTRITMTLTGLCGAYGDALRRSSEDTDAVKDILAGLGFGRTDLKTLDFSVDAEYERISDRGTYRQKFLGYRYRHRTKIEFLSDNERLGRILGALAKSPADPEFRISYTVSDPEKARNELLGRAVADSKEKAKTLTAASGVGLKDVQSIDYSWGQIDLEVRPLNCLSPGSRYDLCDAEMESVSMDFEPDDIAVSDTVTVVWEIG